MIRHVSPVQRANFELLRGAAESLPPVVRRVMRRPTYGMNWSLAQRLPRTVRDNFWLVPGRDILCLVHASGAHEASSSCAPTELALHHGVVAISLRNHGAFGPTDRTIVGVMPDRATGAVVHTGVAQTTVPVSRHLFVLRDSVKEAPDNVSVR
ncbi:MAG TPA: hypothetical protein VKB03_03150 [Conexibacter sp.]|nr:hypothetical protein [Conexibacter sp.]